MRHLINCTSIAISSLLLVATACDAPSSSRPIVDIGDVLIPDAAAQTSDNVFTIVANFAELRDAGAVMIPCAGGDEVFLVRGPLRITFVSDFTNISVNQLGETRCAQVSSSGQNLEFLENSGLYIDSDHQLTIGRGQTIVSGIRL